MRTLRKSTVHAYDRTDPTTGARVHVKEHSDKRTRRVEPIRNTATRRLLGTASRLLQRDVDLAQQGQRGKEGPQEQKPKQEERTARPEPKPQRNNSQPAPGDIRVGSKDPPPIVHQVLQRIQAGENVEQIHRSIVSGGSIAPLAKFDLWLAAIDHPLAKHPGNSFQRLAAFLHEAKGKLDAKQGTAQKAEQAANRDTRPPVEKESALIQKQAVENGAAERAKEQDAFVETLGGAEDGATFILPKAPKSMIGAWQKQTIGGETYWKKGSQYKESRDFLAYRGTVERQLGEEQPATQMRQREKAKPDNKVLAFRKKGDRPVPSGAAAASGYLSTIPAERLGKEAKVYTDQGDEAQVQYALVEADELLSSHDENFGTNPNFPSELQPRDRRSAASHAQIQGIIARFQPALLGQNVKASEGAPMVGAEDGAVEIGNGRSIALKQIYASDRYQDERDTYRGWLQDEAEDVGIDAAEVGKMRKPVLIRVRKTEVDREQFIGATNKGAQAVYSTTEQAKNDAANVTPGMLGLYRPGTMEGILAPENNRFVQSFMATLDPAEIGNLVNNEGALSQTGERRLKNAMLYAAYGSKSLVKRVAEATDAEAKTVNAALEDAAPQVAKVRFEAKDSTQRSMDISSDIGRAADVFVALKAQRLSVGDYLAQSDIEGDQLSPEGKEMLQIFDQHSRSKKKLGVFLNAYLGIAETQGGMFAGPPIEKMEAIHMAAERVNREPNLFKSRLVLCKGGGMAYRTSALRKAITGRRGHWRLMNTKAGRAYVWVHDHEVTYQEGQGDMFAPHRRGEASSQPGLFGQEAKRQTPDPPTRSRLLMRRHNKPVHDEKQPGLFAEKTEADSPHHRADSWAQRKKEQQKNQEEKNQEEKEPGLFDKPKEKERTQPEKEEQKEEQKEEAKPEQKEEAGANVKPTTDTEKQRIAATWGPGTALSDEAAARLNALADDAKPATEEKPEIDKLPSGVRMLAEKHIGALQSFAEEQGRVGGLDQVFSGEGRYVQDLWDNRGHEVEQAEAFLTKFENLASENDIDHEKVYRELGGRPEIKRPATSPSVTANEVEKEEVSASSAGHFLVNNETKRLEMHFDKAAYQALSEDQKKEIKSNFLWSRGSSAWVSRSKSNHYWAETIAKKLGLADQGKKGERLSFEEQVDRDKERAEARSDRQWDRAERMKKEGQAAQAPLDRMRGDTAFFTQPARGTAFGRQRDKMYERNRAGMKKEMAGNELAARAAATARDAKKPEHKDPRFVGERIAEAEAEIRRIDRELAEATRLGSVKYAERLKEQRTEQEEKLDFYQAKKAEIHASGTPEHSKATVKKGDIVKIRGHLHEVVGLGSKNVSIRTIGGPTHGWPGRYPYAEIQELHTDDEAKREAAVVKQKALEPKIEANQKQVDRHQLRLTSLQEDEAAQESRGGSTYSNEIRTLKLNIANGQEMLARDQAELNEVNRVLSGGESAVAPKKKEPEAAGPLSQPALPTARPTESAEGAIWNAAAPEKRIEMVRQLGWVTGKGDLSSTGRKIANSDWAELSPAAQNLLTRKAGRGSPWAPKEEAEATGLSQAGLEEPDNGAIPESEQKAESSSPLFAPEEAKEKGQEVLITAASQHLLGAAELTPFNRGAIRHELGMDTEINGKKVSEMGDRRLTQAYVEHHGQEAPAVQPEPVPERKRTLVLSKPARDGKKTAASLRTKAEGMQQTIDQKNDPGAGHQNPTRRRAAQVGASYDEARRLERIQEHMHGLADAHEQGTVPESLNGVTTRGQIETLLTTHDKYPQASVRHDDTQKLLDVIKGTRGASEIRNKIEPILRRKDDEGRPWTNLYGAEELAAVTELQSQAKKIVGDTTAGGISKWTLNNYLEGVVKEKHLRAAGIHDQEAYDQARADLRTIGASRQRPGATEKERKIRELKNDMIGTKAAGFFPTPTALGGHVVELAQIGPGHTVLEPSAGMGDLAKEVRRNHPDAIITTDERHSGLREILELEGFAPQKSDFLERTPADGTFDRIVMNPPFEDGMDMVHVQHAYSLLKPGGRLVSIMGEGAFFRENEPHRKFRAWLDDRGGSHEKNPEKSFTGAGAFRQTGVATRTVVIDKPASVNKSHGRLLWVPSSMPGRKKAA